MQCMLPPIMLCLHACMNCMSVRDFNHINIGISMEAHKFTAMCGIYDTTNVSYVSYIIIEY